MAMDGVPIPRGDISLMLLGVELALLLPLLQGISLQVSSFQSELRESTCKAQCGIMWSCPISQTLTSANKYHKYQLCLQFVQSLQLSLGSCVILSKVHGWYRAIIAKTIVRMQRNVGNFVRDFWRRSMAHNDHNGIMSFVRFKHFKTAEVKGSLRAPESGSLRAPDNLEHHGIT